MHEVKKGGAVVIPDSDGTEFCYRFDVNLIIEGYFVRCKKHPKYRALRRPTANCTSCWTMYKDRVKNG